MNKIILSVALSAITVSAPVLAQTGQYSTTPVVAKQVVANPVDTPVSTTLQATANQPVDISFAFKDGQNLQVKDMTQTEMEETQGALAPIVYYGLVYGVPASYAVAQWATGPGPQILHHRIKNWLDK